MRKRREGETEERQREDDGERGRETERFEF